MGIFISNTLCSRPKVTTWKGNIVLRHYAQLQRHLFNCFLQKCIISLYILIIWGLLVPDRSGLFRILVPPQNNPLVCSLKYLAYLFTTAEGPSYARKLSLIPRQILACERCQTSYRTVLQFAWEMSFQILVHALLWLFKIIWCSEHGVIIRIFFIKGKLLA